MMFLFVSRFDECWIYIRSIWEERSSGLQTCSLNKIGFYQKAEKAEEQNSPPLSVLRVQMEEPDSFSTKALNCWNTGKASDFCLRKYTHILRLKSSTKSKKYLFPEIEEVFIGPHTSAWTSWSTLDARHDSPFLNGVLCCFPTWQAPQTGWF